MRSPTSRPAFTLIELLVVIAIIAVLAAILFPVFAKAREKAYQTHCMNNMRQISTSIMMYVQDNEEKFPLAQNWVTAIGGSNDSGVYDCPSSTFVGTPSTPDYFFVAGSFLSGAALGDITKPEDAPVLCELKNSDLPTTKSYIDDAGKPMAYLGDASAKVDFRHNNSTDIAYVDGHVALLPQTQMSDSIFAPSFVMPATISQPTFLGTIATGQMTDATIADNNVLQTKLAASNITKILCGGSNGNNTFNQANVDFLNGAPSWCSAIPICTKVGGTTYQHTSTAGFYMSGTFRGTTYNTKLSSVFGAYYAAGGVATLAITPSADAGVKLAALIVSTESNSNRQGFLKVTTIQVGPDGDPNTKIFTYNKQMVANALGGQPAHPAAELLALPITANWPIKLTIDYSNPNNAGATVFSGVYMAFQN